MSLRVVNATRRCDDDEEMLRETMVSFASCSVAWLERFSAACLLSLLIEISSFL